MLICSQRAVRVAARSFVNVWWVAAANNGYLFVMKS